MNIYEESIEFHKKHGGKLDINPKFNITSKHDLSLAYTPGVAGVCEAIAKDESLASDLTIKKNTVAIVTDGSAVLGLGNIGASASIPVMEGKALLFKEYAGIDAFPICIESQNTSEIVNIIKNVKPMFAGVNLEDIAAPKCFEVETMLQDIGIPVFHDDQHGTAIVTLAALLNAAKLAKKDIKDLKVVINGAGAAGSAIADMLLGMNYVGEDTVSVKEIIICDSKGAIYESRSDLSENAAKLRLARKTNRNNVEGSLADALVDADVFIGVSVAGAVTKDMIRTMAKDPIIFAMANPVPEIMPDEAKEAGAFIVGTGRSDFPNQVNNVLAFPGIFRGALDAKATQFTHDMKLAAAEAIAEAVTNLDVDNILPQVLDKDVPYKVAEKVKQTYLNSVS
ncbi:MAG: NADP-dependent malic enzyme [Candidatus Margulisiibacteriota bacterium]|nr:NADP-dependent malic enzyme [Candidatus Margulisiibacteriota bacterium]